MKKIPSRNISFDILNVLSCFAVICLHCNNDVYNVANTTAWKFSLLVQCLTMWCVPVFFMLTGAKLINYRSKYSTKLFFKKRITKTLIPLLFWSTIHLFRKLYLNKLEVTAISSLIGCYTTGNIEGTYWFFYSLFGIYLAIPILSALVSKNEIAILWYIFILSILYNTLFPILNYFFNFQINSSILGNFSGYIGYAILGYLITTSDIFKRKKYIFYILGITGAITMWIGTYYINIIIPQTNSLNKLFMTFSSINNYFMAIAIFIFVSSINYENLNLQIRSIILKLSSASFGIYLIHMLLIYIINDCIVTLNTASIYYKTVGVIVLYTISFFIVTLIKRISIIKHIVP